MQQRKYNKIKSRDSPVALNFIGSEELHCRFGTYRTYERVGLIGSPKDTREAVPRGSRHLMLTDSHRFWLYQISKRDHDELENLHTTSPHEQNTQLHSARLPELKMHRRHGR